MRGSQEEVVMSGRIFQNVVLQFKETTDRTIGVIDADYVKEHKTRDTAQLAHRRGGGRLHHAGGTPLQSAAQLGNAL